jgi:hypothetical protein
MEIYKEILGYEGKYYVSNLGNIKSSPKEHRRKEIELKKIPLKLKYLSVDLCKDKKTKRFLVHRLVALAFIPNLENKPQVNHINGIKTDNRVENLEWVTSSENQLHAFSIGLRSATGCKNNSSKLTENEVMEIFNDKRPYNQIMADFKISIPTISDIKRGYSWTHITKMPNLKKSGNRKQILVIK